MKELILTKKEAREKLVNAKKVIVAIADFGRYYGGGSFPYYNLYVEDENGNIELIICEEIGYWNKKKQAYKMDVFGMDRVFALLKAIAEDNKLANELDRKTVRLF